MDLRLFFVVFAILSCLGTIHTQSLDIPDCLQYTQQGLCLTCAEQYEVSQNGKQCLKRMLSTAQEIYASRLLQTNGACYTQTCVANCQVCANPTTCSTCQNGFIYSASNNTCHCSSSNCTTCNVDNCAMCSSQNMCKSCLVGYNLVSDINFCMKCNVPNCASCNSWNFCSTCNMGMSVSIAGTCVSCTTTSCVICNGMGTCVACMAGYVLTTSNTCVTCNVVGCSACNSNNVCSACQVGYVIMTNSTGSYCNPCVEPCSTCNANGTCATCISPQFSSTPLSNGTCYQCLVQFCMTCSSTNTLNCTQCLSGYIPNSNGSCILSCANPNCLTCTASPSACTACKTFYYLSGSTCIACPDSPKCVACNPTNASSCTYCYPGYWLSSNGQCMPCASWCSKCTSATVCITPLIPFGVVIVNSGMGLAACSSGCSMCSPANPVYCYQCLSGFSLMSSGYCQPCMYPCATCNSNNVSSCMSCVDGAIYNSANNSCTMCGPNCNSCNSLNNCTACQFSYVLSLGSCSNSCSQNCKTCTSPVMCTLCYDGYTVNTTGFCVPCLTGCKKCSGINPTVCLSCGTGFTMVAISFNQILTGICSSCPQQCAACGPTPSNGIICLFCNPGWVLSQSFGCIMVLCNFPCLTCNPANPSQCYSCFAGYSYQATSNTCPPITSLCNVGSVIGTGTSGVCPLSWTMRQGQCIQCQGNCGNCWTNSTSTCTACKVGLYLQSTNNLCFGCPVGCIVCTNSNTCQLCASGYILVVQPTSKPSICSACLYPCVTCVNQVSQCVSCASGFILQGWACATSYNLGVQVQLNTSITNFFNSSQYTSYLIALFSFSNSASLNNITTNSVVTGSVNTTSIVSVQQSNSNAVLTAYNGLMNGLAQGNAIGGVSILHSSVTANGDLPDTGGVNVTLILAICIPVGVVLIVAIGVLIYCRYKKSSNVIEKKIQEDGLTVRETFELSNDMTGRKLEAI